MPSQTERPALWPRLRSASFLILIGLIACLAASGAAQAGLRLASWNIQHLGWGDGTDTAAKRGGKKEDGGKDYRALARVMSGFDLVAVQEVMRESAVGRLEAELENLTGEPWSSLVSAVSGRTSGKSPYREAYAFVWRESAVRFVGGAVTYLDPGDIFQREPFSAEFEDVAEGFRFALATVHVTFGQDKSDRTAELNALADYWDWLGEAHPDVPDRILAGDFNMGPGDRSWSRFRAASGARALIDNGLTTLARTEGCYSELYDNIWIRPAGSLSISASGILQAPALLGLSNDAYLDRISDHVPVWVALGESPGKLPSTSWTDTCPIGGKALKKSARLPSVEVPAGAGAHVVAPQGPGAVGNLSSRVYHLRHCPGFAQNGPNRVEFSDPGAAEAQGYRLARTCRAG